MRSGYNTGDMRPPRKQASAEHHYNRILHKYLEGGSGEGALLRRPSDRRKHSLSNWTFSSPKAANLPLKNETLQNAVHQGTEGIVIQHPKPIQRLHSFFVFLVRVERSVVSISVHSFSYKQLLCYSGYGGLCLSCLLVSTAGG